VKHDDGGTAGADAGRFAAAASADAASPGGGASLKASPGPEFEKEADASSRPSLRKLGFLTIGLFDPADPASGHETTLQTIELGERLASTAPGCATAIFSLGFPPPLR
jgi:hypothetical protein